MINGAYTFFHLPIMFCHPYDLPSSLLSSGAVADVLTDGKLYINGYLFA